MSCQPSYSNTEAESPNSVVVLNRREMSGLDSDIGLIDEITLLYISQDKGDITLDKKKI